MASTCMRKQGTKSVSRSIILVAAWGVVLVSDPARHKVHEAAALIRYKGKYIAAGSGVEGGNPTDTRYAVADAPLGPYREMGLMSQL